MMDDLTSHDKKKVIVGVLRNAANKNIRANLKQNSPFKGDGKHQQFITIADKKNSLGIISGVSGDYFYYRFSEFGTKQRFTKGYKVKKGFTKTGRKVKVKVKRPVLNRGVMPRNPFIVEQIEKNINPIVDYFIFDFGAKVAARLKALARKKG